MLFHSGKGKYPVPATEFSQCFLWEHWIIILILNTDALIFFADQIVPMLRKKIRGQWRLRVVGTISQKSWIKRLKEISEMEFVGWVDDLGSEYSTADVVIAPVRGGGGTRIKIPEAFAYGVSVISTSMGSAGLDVENKIHLPIADDAEAFAEACLRLMTDSVLRDEISRRAFDLAASKYCPDIVTSAWSKLYDKT
jgi:glycosyltransferase involved in cell wall biosynthesis